MVKILDLQGRFFRGVLIILALFFTLVWIEPGGAQKFPEKPLTMIVPFVAGSGLDLEVRLIQPYFQKYLGVSVVLSNVPGADRKIGLQKAFKAPSDGYTLISPGWPMPVGELAFNPHKFTYVGAWTRNNFVLVVNSETWQNMEEFVSAAKSKKLNCGLSNIAGMSRILGEALLDAAGIKEFNWVFYPGANDAMVQLAGKHLDFVITTNSSATGLVRAGKIKPIMVFSNDVDDVFPEAPLAKALGYNVPPLSTIRLVLAPPKTPAGRIKVLEQALLKAAKDPLYQKMIKERRMTTYIQNSNEIKKEIEESYPVIDKYLAKIGFAMTYKE